LSEEDFNIETRQLNNDEDEEENVAESVSNLATKSR
jgi:carbonic anhydrase